MNSLIIIFPLGTFGRIFHGILVDDKDPNKEKQTFVKTVKGRIYFPYCFYSAFLRWFMPVQFCLKSSVYARLFNQSMLI